MNQRTRKCCGGCVCVCVCGDVSGQSMTCPVCLVEFVVPEAGLPALPRNVYVETLVGIQHRARKSAAAAATSSSVDGQRRSSCTSIVQTSTEREHWLTAAPSAAERGFSYFNAPIIIMKIFKDLHWHEALLLILKLPVKQS